MCRWNELLYQYMADSCGTAADAVNGACSPQYFFLGSADCLREGWRRVANGAAANVTAARAAAITRAFTALQASCGALTTEVRFF